MVGGLSVLVAICMTLSLTLVSAYEITTTEYNEDFKVECHFGEAITRLSSVHSTDKKDRSWTIICDQNGEFYFVKNCAWSDFINEYDKVMNFLCPKDTAVAGISSEFSAPHWDRRYKLKCCHVWEMGLSGNAETDLKSVELTGFRNNLGDPLNYDVPSDRFIIGMYSYHKNPPEDRAFKFFVAKPADP